MRLHQLATLSFLAVAAALPAMAQPTQSDVGSFLRGPDGAVIGSLKALHGDQAVVWYGFVNTPGNHLATVPAGQISSWGNRLVLESAVLPSLAAR